MSATLAALLALIEAALNDAPGIFTTIQNLLNNHPANPANGGGQSLAQTVAAGTAAAENALHNTVLK